MVRLLTKFGLEGTVDYFREFGCKAFCLNKAPTKGKLDDRSKEGIFVGYADQSKAYRIWLPDSRKIEVTRDVRFLENDRKYPEDDVIERDWVDIDAVRESSETTIPNPVVMQELQPKSSDNEDEVWESARDARQDGNLSDWSGNEEEFRGFTPEPDGRDVREENALPTQKRGRPRIIRTGRLGRPRKDYTGHFNQSVIADIAEVSTSKAISGHDSPDWKDAMASEVKSLINNDTWQLVVRPDGQRVIGSRFVLRNKYKPDGSIDKRKARVVARGFAQRPDIDFQDTFAPVARLASIRAAVAIAFAKNMKFRQLDISTAYLNGHIEEQIFMEAPKHLVEILDHIVKTEEKDMSIKERAKEMMGQLRKGDMVCLLNKALYGLRQAGRAWNIRLDGELRSLGAVPSEADPCVYYIQTAKIRSFIIVYVDDILIMSNSDSEINRLKNHLCRKFDIKDLGDLRYCLGLEFDIKDDYIAVNQKGYIDDILKRFNMSDCNPVSIPLELGIKLTKDEEKGDCPKNIPYRELLGGLMYVPMGTRPNITHAVSYLSQFCNCYGKSHWKAAKRVLRYLQGTRDLGLVYSRSSEPPLMYTDAIWGSLKLIRNL